MLNSWELFKGSFSFYKSMGKWQKKYLSSFDYKLVICFSILSFLSLPVSLALSFNGALTVTIILAIATIFTSLGIQHRIKHQWRWQGVKGKDLYKAIAISYLPYSALKD